MAAMSTDEWDVRMILTLSLPASKDPVSSSSSPTRIGYIEACFDVNVKKFNL
jgi:hypothetical protein